MPNSASIRRNIHAGVVATIGTVIGALTPAAVMGGNPDFVIGSAAVSAIGLTFSPSKRSGITKVAMGIAAGTLIAFLAKSTGIEPGASHASIPQCALASGTAAATVVASGFSLDR